jgi:hypothetical protein
MAGHNVERFVSQHNLATACWANRQCIDAEDMLKQVVAAQQKNLCTDHPNRLLSEEVLVYYTAQRNAQLSSAPASKVLSEDTEGVLRGSLGPGLMRYAEDVSSMKAGRKSMLSKIRNWRVSSHST